MTDYLSPQFHPAISCGGIRTVLPVKSLIYSVFHRNFLGVEQRLGERVRSGVVQLLVR